MADYYPLIARAVSRLESNTNDARQIVYERARTALIAQLTKESAISEREITLERAALEQAIRAVEQESSTENDQSQRLNRRGSTTLLIFSILFFPVLWVIEPICMSVYWVARLPVPRTSRSRLKPWPSTSFNGAKAKRSGQLAEVMIPKTVPKEEPSSTVAPPVTGPKTALRAAHPGSRTTSRLVERATSALPITRLIFQNQGWRVFTAGFLCGLLFMGVAWVLSLWDSVPERSANDAAIYDRCLAQKGNVVACDAMMRIIERQRTHPP
jgi:hypothetical protein